MHDFFVAHGMHHHRAQTKTINTCANAIATPGRPSLRVSPSDRAPEFFGNKWHDWVQGAKKLIKDMPKYAL
jgi:hypothetical protein